MWCHAQCTPLPGRTRAGVKLGWSKCMRLHPGAALHACTSGLRVIVSGNWIQRCRSCTACVHGASPDMCAGHGISHVYMTRALYMGPYSIPDFPMGYLGPLFPWIVIGMYAHLQVWSTAGALIVQKLSSLSSATLTSSPSTSGKWSPSNSLTSTLMTGLK